jgi:ABC-type antimicrobial peptide transport system permease subunit
VYWPTFGAIPVAAGVTRNATFTLRSARTGSEEFLREVEQAVWSVNANLSVAAAQSMAELHARSMARTSFTLVMLAIAGAMALALGLIGIYGVISYAVSQRTREIGIRLALGAQQAAVRRMFVRYGLTLTGAGVIVGVAAAFALTRLMRSLLFNVSPLDPWTYAAVPLALIVAAVLASYLPARRASAVDPIGALKAE